MAKTWAGVDIPPRFGVEPDITAILAKYNASIAGGTVTDYDTTTARDQDLAGLPAAARRGALTFVAGRGWTGYDGSQWQDFTNIKMKWGRTDGIVEGNGNARVLSGFCFFDGQPPSLIAAFSVMGPQYNFGWSLNDGAGALIKCWDIAENHAVPTGFQVAFQWIAIK